MSSSINRNHNTNIKKIKSNIHIQTFVQVINNDLELISDENDDILLNNDEEQILNDNDDTRISNDDNEDSATLVTEYVHDPTENDQRI